MFQIPTVLYAVMCATVVHKSTLDLGLYYVDLMRFFCKWFLNWVSCIFLVHFSWYFLLVVSCEFVSTGAVDFLERSSSEMTCLCRVAWTLILTRSMGHYLINSLTLVFYTVYLTGVIIRTVVCCIVC